jgi:hypothetical protein
VAAGVGLLEVGDSEADIVLERVEILVTEELLDVPEAGSPRE